MSNRKDEKGQPVSNEYSLCVDYSRHFKGPEGDRKIFVLMRMKQLVGFLLELQKKMHKC